MKLRSNKVILQGDSHGLQYLHDKVGSIPEGANWIHLGDVGLGFITSNWQAGRKRDLDSLNDLSLKIQHKNIRLFLVNGNHDQPDYWGEDTPNIKNIRFLQDGEILQFPNGKDVLCFGGGISIDRCTRFPFRTWWPEEKTSPFSASKADFVFSHDCPSYINHSTGGLKKSFPNLVMADKTLLEDCDQQRKLVDGVFDKAQPRVWMYGHYHNSLSETANGCKFKCVDINKLFEFDAEKETYQQL